MKRFGNESKWSNFYHQLDIQAKNNDDIIFISIPDEATDDEIEGVLQDLRSLSNFKDYHILRSNDKIKGVRYA